VRQWVKRPRDGADAPLPGWMRTIDEFSPTRSVALGSALSAVNPKNLLLTVAAAAAIAGSATSAGQEAVAFAVFVGIATLGPGVPVAVYFVLGERAERSLDTLKTWLSVHNAAIMAVLCLVIGAKLVGDGIAGLG
jgi:threonine/homoserine/homoserine lactone efflux protein